MLPQAGELRGKAEPIAALSLLTEAHRRFPDDAAIASAYGRLDAISSWPSASARRP
jgi:hypothetical protein